MMAGLQLTLLLQFCFVFYVAAKSCSISLDDFETEPVYLTSVDGGKLYDTFKPEGRVTDIDDGTQLLLLCPGNSNKLKINGAVTIELTCKNGAFEDSNNKIYALKDLQCESVPSPALYDTKEPCAKNEGVIFKVGYNYYKEKKNLFASVYNICYNKPGNNIYYTHNVINGKAIDNSITVSSPPSFRTEGMKIKSADNIYRTDNQRQRFLNSFNAKVLDTPIDRGHLVPRADGVTRYEQYATFYFCNVQPEFKSINSGNWRMVEAMVRDTAKYFKTDLIVYNGVIGNLEWKNNAGRMEKVYLDNEKLFPVPKYLFKVVLMGDAGIVFVTTNDPYIVNPRADTYCTNVCHEANMIGKQFTIPKHGYTICCKVKEFMEKYKFLPKSLSSVNKLLEMPQSEPTTNVSNKKQKTT